MSPARRIESLTENKAAVSGNNRDGGGDQAN